VGRHCGEALLQHLVGVDDLIKARERGRPYIYNQYINYSVQRTLSSNKLLEWSTIGAHNAVNQYALPAAIIILNGPTVEVDRWISENQDEVTEDFFKSVEQEIFESSTLREMAQKVS